MTDIDITIPTTISPFELELVRAVGRAAGLADHCVLDDGAQVRISNRCAVALLEAASDIEGSLGDNGAWVDEIVAALAPAVQATLGPQWAVAAEGVVICAAVDASDRFDQLAVSALRGALQLEGSGAADYACATLGPDVAWLC